MSVMRNQSLLRCAQLAITAAVIAGGMSNTVRAESDFWSRIPGFGGDLDRETKRPTAAPDTVEDLRPNNVPFRSEAMLDAMDAVYQRYQKIVSAGGWPLVPGPRMIRPGDDDQRVPALRRRLVAEGYLRRVSSYDNFTYDGELEVAVKKFQETHGLRPSGRVDRPTLEELNVSAEARLKQVRLNATRLQELQQQRPDERYILVNVPAFQLEAVEKHEVQMRHRVIVGRNERETPNVRATVKALNFFPYWRVPDSIGKLDLVPRLRKEPDYIEKEKIRVFAAADGKEMDSRAIDWNQVDPARIKFKQDPGPQNALGLVRIDMINEHGVYMHDTPMKNLFDQRARNFSAGCVRVQDVFQLAEWIARYEIGWENPGRAQSVVQSGQALDVSLSRPMPVIFTYITAWGEPNGVVHFRPDIYNRDGVNSANPGELDPNEHPPVPIPVQALAP